MKLDTLRRFFASHKRTKLFIATPDFAVTGFAGRPRGDGETLQIDLSPYVVFFHRGASLVRGRETFGPVTLGPDVLVTRRLRTHERHLARAGVPPRYFEEAERLRSEPKVEGGGNSPTSAE